MRTDLFPVLCSHITHCQQARRPRACWLGDAGAASWAESTSKYTWTALKVTLPLISLRGLIGTVQAIRVLECFLLLSVDDIHHPNSGTLPMGHSLIPARTRLPVTLFVNNGGCHEKAVWVGLQRLWEMRASPFIPSRLWMYTVWTSVVCIYIVICQSKKLDPYNFCYNFGKFCLI